MTPIYNNHDELFKQIYIYTALEKNKWIKSVMHFNYSAYLHLKMYEYFEYYSDSDSSEWDNSESYIYYDDK
jgi:hypothetical protein